MCTECYEWRTRHPTGICSKCRNYEVDEKEGAGILRRYQAATYIPYPEGFGKKNIGCRGQNGEFDKPNASQNARETCWRCPMYSWCLSWGIENDEQGIWGGLSRGERRQVRNGALTRSDVILVA